MLSFVWGRLAGFASLVTPQQPEELLLTDSNTELHGMHLEISGTTPPTCDMDDVYVELRDFCADEHGLNICGTSEQTTSEPVTSAAGTEEDEEEEKKDEDEDDEEEEGEDENVEAEEKDEEGEDKEEAEGGEEGGAEKESAFQQELTKDYENLLTGLRSGDEEQAELQKQDELRASASLEEESNQDAAMPPSALINRTQYVYPEKVAGRTIKFAEGLNHCKRIHNEGWKHRHDCKPVRQPPQIDEFPSSVDRESAWQRALEFFDGLKASCQSREDYEKSLLLACGARRESEDSRVITLEQFSRARFPTFVHFESFFMRVAYEAALRGMYLFDVDGTAICASRKRWELEADLREPFLIMGEGFVSEYPRRDIARWYSEVPIAFFAEIMDMHRDMLKLRIPHQLLAATMEQVPTWTECELEHVFQAERTARNHHLLSTPLIPGELFSNVVVLAATYFLRAGQRCPYASKCARLFMGEEGLMWEVVVDFDSKGEEPFRMTMDVAETIFEPLCATIHSSALNAQEYLEPLLIGTSLPKHVKFGNAHEWDTDYPWYSSLDAFVPVVGPNQHLQAALKQTRFVQQAAIKRLRINQEEVWQRRRAMVDSYEAQAHGQQEDVAHVVAHGDRSLDVAAETTDKMEEERVEAAADEPHSSSPSETSLERTDARGGDINDPNIIAPDDSNNINPPSENLFTEARIIAEMFAALEAHIEEFRRPKEIPTTVSAMIPTADEPEPAVKAKPWWAPRKPRSKVDTPRADSATAPVSQAAPSEGRAEPPRQQRQAPPAVPPGNPARVSRSARARAAEEKHLARMAHAKQPAPTAQPRTSISRTR